jgi:hypothetical protein
MMKLFEDRQDAHDKRWAVNWPIFEFASQRVDVNVVLERSASSQDDQQEVDWHVVHVFRQEEDFVLSFQES